MRSEVFFYLASVTVRMQAVYKEIQNKIGGRPGELLDSSS